MRVASAVMGAFDDRRPVCARDLWGRQRPAFRPRCSLQGARNAAARAMGVGWARGTRKEPAMNQLIVVAFDHLDDARRAMASLRSLEREGRIRFEDTAIVEREADGKAHVRNEVSGTTETAAVVGALVGGLVGFMFPLAGIAIGAALGAAIGVAMDRGVSADFIDEVKKTLTPGRSALFLVVKESDADATTAALRPFTGEIIQTTLDSEAEDALRNALV
jgi:uncharacterized membrane protein